MSNTIQNKQRIILQTKLWIKTVVIEHNYCPFAKREMDKGSVRYTIVNEIEFNHLLEAVSEEFIWLDNNKSIETTFIIFPAKALEFDLFLDCLYLVENLLKSQGYDGIYQIASFHPDYCFQGAEDNDPANYTNRSPYPMFHILREVSLESALKSHPDPESIPERNMQYARQQGLEKMESLLQHCLSSDGPDV